MIRYADDWLSVSWEAEAEGHWTFLDNWSETQPQPPSGKRPDW